MTYKSGHFTDDDVVSLLTTKLGDFETIPAELLQELEKAQQHIVDCPDCAEKFLAAEDRHLKQSRLNESEEDDDPGQDQAETFSDPEPGLCVRCGGETPRATITICGNCEQEVLDDEDEGLEEDID